MRAVKTTLLEIIILIVVGTGLAFTVNAVRAKGSLKVNKDHFDKGRPIAAVDRGSQGIFAERSPGTAKVKPGDSVTPARSAEPVETAPDQSETGAGRRPDAAEGVHRTPVEDVQAGAEPAKSGTAAEQVKPTEGGHIQHDYQSISLKDVIDAFNDPLTAKGLNVFIDARNDQHFEEGHIPGAVQFDPYHVEQYLDAAAAKANAAEKVIVYCNGGDCEDSIYACRELLTAGVPYESIYLFEGGWKEWSAAQQPVSPGREE
jgi:rhodanese-related sulfurtransferase